MRRDASLEPDGLKVPFYRSVWEWIKQDVIELIVTKSTTQVIELPGLIIETVIVLIPKNQMSSTQPHSIHHSWYAFVQGRHVPNNIIIAQEIVHSDSLPGNVKGSCSNLTYLRHLIA